MCAATTRNAAPEVWDAHDPGTSKLGMLQKWCEWNPPILSMAYLTKKVLIGHLLRRFFFPILVVMYRSFAAQEAARLRQERK
jgi:hypothetical protein